MLIEKRKIKITIEERPLPGVALVALACGCGECCFKGRKLVVKYNKWIPKNEATLN